MTKTARETVTHVPTSRLAPNPWGPEVGPPLSAEDDEALRLALVAVLPLLKRVWERHAREGISREHGHR
jgi:hypothetical protein